MTQQTKIDPEALAAAKALILAAREAEYAEKANENRALIGKCYRYRNSYGVGSDIGPWWLYTQVTGVDDMGTTLAWSFQRIPNGDVEIRTERSAYIVGNGYEEITPAAFWKAAASVRDAVIANLTPKVSP